MTEQEKPEGAEETKAEAEATEETKAEAEEKAEAAPEKSEEKAEAAPEKSEEKAEEKAEAAPEKSEEKAEDKSEPEAAEEKAAPEKKAEEPVAKDKKAKGKKKKVEEPAAEPAAAKTPVPAAAREEKRDEEVRPAPQPVHTGRDSASAGPSGDPFGMMGVFKTPAEIFHACEELRDAGYVHFDAHTPFPVHGLENAMALPPSKLPWLVLCGGATGLISAVLLAYYTQEVWYSHIISGKEPFSYQAFVPIFFELTVLFSALTCFVSVWALPKLPTFFHPTMTHPAFPRASDDAFLISVEARDPKYDAAKTRRLLEKLGAQDVQEIAQ